MKNILYGFIYIVAASCFLSCRKQNDFLDAKPNASLSTINSLQDCQNLMQDTYVFNEYSDAGLGEIASDDFYLSNSSYLEITAPEQNSYIWADVIDPAGQADLDFSKEYTKVYYANTVIESLANLQINPSQKALFNQTEGAALFYRAYAFYDLVQTFALPYDSSNSSTTLGIPLILSSDFNKPVTRASEANCYNQIISDLKQASILLPLHSSVVTNPSIPACYGLLARVYLGMSNYIEAGKYADSCLQLYSTLTDYNTITSPRNGELNSRGKFMSEDIFHATLENYDVLITNYYSIADSSLYASYSNADRRKTLFYILHSGLPYFRGTYDYYGYCYSGIATDEMYLIRAEAFARQGNALAACADINSLLVNRFETGTYVPITSNDPDSVLSTILTERRKELIFRGLRWTDLRRLNKDSLYAITLTRSINGQSYSLSPNDPRYAFPFDDLEIQLTGIQQNTR